MRTVSTQSLLNSVARKMGLDPTAQGNVNSNIASALLTYCDERAREIWEMYDWQDLTIYEQRAYATVGLEGQNFNIGDIVYDPIQALYFQSNYGGVGLPSEAPGLWTQLTIGYFLPFQPLLDSAIIGQPAPIPAYVPFFQASGIPTALTYSPGQTPTLNYPSSTPVPTGIIDTVFGVYAGDPRLTSHPIPVTYSVSGRGVELFHIKRPTVWIVYRPPYPGLGHDVWDPTVTYNIGDNVFYNGDTWANLTGVNTITAPNTDTTNWQIFQLPYVLSEYVKAMAYGDALAEDGQEDKAEAQWNIAAAKAVAQFEKQQTQQGLTTTWSVNVQRHGSWV